MSCGFERDSDGVFFVFLFFFGGGFVCDVRVVICIRRVILDTHIAPSESEKTDK